MNKNILYFILFAIAMAVVVAIIAVGDKGDVQVDDQDVRELGEDEFIDALYTSLRLGYEHTAPGEYSEIIVSHRAQRGDEVTFVLKGADESELNSRTVTAGDDGTMYEKFKIYTYGTYEVVARHADGKMYNQYVTVE